MRKELTVPMIWVGFVDFTVFISFLGRELRTLVIEMVMSTDMSCHFQQIKTMKTALTQTDKSETFRILHTRCINLQKH